MPLVSVIIPTFNRARFVGRAIDSVLSQTFQDFELIVVDDGSTDGTAELLSKNYPNIRIFLQPNRGVASARNLGIRNASGELIAFLDSDDEWLPRKLEKQVSLYDSHEPFFICHSDEIWIRNGCELKQQAKHKKQGGRFFERALERCLISPSSVIISRALLDKVGLFDESLLAAEDYDMWLRITAFHTVRFVEEALIIKHGGHSDQLSVITEAIDVYRILAVQKVLKFDNLSQDYQRAAIRELTKKCAIVAKGCEKRGKTREAQIYLEVARAYNAAVR